MKKIILLGLLIAAYPMPALEFESSEGAKSAPAKRQGAETTVPLLIDAGDAPTAYGLLKYELRADVRYYPGGGILSKVYLGIFPRFFLGAGLSVPGLVNEGPVSLVREDASLLAKVVVITEDETLPAVSLGYDGPAYDRGELRGAYLVLSKEFKTPLGYFQAHAGANSSYFDNGWQADRNLRGFASVTTTFRQVTGFFECDEINNPIGPRYDGGIRVFFDPISLGIEFHDVGATRFYDVGGTRTGIQSSRLLRVSYTGLF